ncbi:MAG TPA: FAD-binding oxidoreductase [Anaerolineae bacterium]|nr:FAD-binding oxidoreductase [Anaerolineae bacterium]
MKRWNGWGNTHIDAPLPSLADQFLADRIGPSSPPDDASFDDVLTTIPSSRLPSHPLITTDPAERLRHARGQSLPDWIALRSGTIPAFPDGVAYPISADQVKSLIQFAADTDTQLIPYGGGTSVVGHINAIADSAPVLTVDLSRLDRLTQFDDMSHLATFGAGILGPNLEAQLRARGFTLGHFPQSFEFSTLGGWVATRSSGQQSLHYGRIEDLFAGGHVVTPSGDLHLPPFPASAAGPDLRQLVLGSEGRLGIITDVTVRVSPLPEREDFHAIFFPSFDHGRDAVRALSQAHLPLSMLRLSTATETETNLTLAGHERFITLVEQLLSVRGVKEEKSMLMMGLTGSTRQVRAARKEAFAITSQYGGVHVGRGFGKQWAKGRFRTPYLRNSLWDKGYAVDTLETAVTWDRVPATIAAIEDALHNTLATDDERCHVFTHLSHIYSSGCSIYTTYLYRLHDDPAVNLDRWQRMKTAASQAIVANNGTISHQHGVGHDHAPYLPAEKGELGMQTLTNLTHQFDPQQFMNPGKLV